MKLTKQHIESLYEFTKQHYVEYYDLQTELVDHLANDIETILEKTPSLSFEVARDQSFKKFGICGFMDVVGKKTKVLNKHYWRLIWREFTSFFKLPKVLLTGFSIWILYLIVNLFKNKMFVFITVALLIVIIPLINLYIEKKKIKHRKQLTGKKWLMDSILLQLGGFIHIINFVFQILITFDNDDWTPLSALIFSTLIVFISLVLFIAVKVVGPNLREQLIKEQPDYLLI